MSLLSANSSWINPRMVSGLCLWLDGSDPLANGTLPANGDYLASWVDKSGKGNNAVQPTLVNQPTYLENAFVNDTKKNGVSFASASSQCFQLQSLIDFPFGSQGRTVFLVASASMPSRQQGLMNYGAQGFTQGFGPIIDGGVPSHIAIDFYGGAIEGVTTVIDSNLTYLFEINYPSGSTIDSSLLYVNSVLQSNSSGSAILSTGNSLGKIGTQLGDFGYLDGNIGEVILYNTALSEANQNMVRQYLVNKYGISAS